VKRANLDGGSLVTLVSGFGLLNGIDVTDDAIYVSQLQFSPQILRMELDGSGVTQVYSAPPDGSALRGLAVVVGVPEPHTYALMLAGIGLVAGAVPSLIAPLAARRRRGALAGC